MLKRLILLMEPVRNLSSVRLGSIEGHDGKKNEIIFHSPCQKPALSNVVYFGGDMQDFKENMVTHRDNKNYADWNLEKTAEILHERFPRDNIVIVKPSKMSLKTFSCYENFMTCNNFGAPTYENTTDALVHLKTLLENALQPCDKTKDDINSNKPVVLIGFSKGCVVLNQLLYSFHSLSDDTDPQIHQFVKLIQEMYWLDGGHSGTAPTWVTDRDVLFSFANLRIIVHIHVTPYQVHCDRRPRIGREERRFRDNLLHLEADVRRKIHFEGEPGSLDFHFKVLEAFKNPFM